VQINGENVVGVTHEEAVSLLRGRPVVGLVVQRDIVPSAGPSSTTTSPDRSSSFTSSSPQRRTAAADQPQSPARSAVIGKEHL